MKGIVTENNQDLRGRLINGKFESALAYLEGESEEVKEIVMSLSNMFGSSGFIYDGDFGILLSAVMTYLIGSEEEL